MRIQRLRIAIPALTASMIAILAACGGGNEGPSRETGPNAQRGASGAMAPNAKKPEHQEAPYEKVPQGSATPSTTDLESGRVDTSDGTLHLAGSGQMEGSWVFEDVTALMDERAGGGTASGELSLEAHNGPAALHFKIRLRNEGKEIVPGTYSLNGTSRKLYARFESGGANFNSFFGGEGSVQLTSISNGRAVGTFNLKLPSDQKGTMVETLKGSFNQALQK